MKNYHTHTKRCYHAIDNEEEYVKAAIQSGYTELGFSDHTPWHYETSYHSTMRMEEDKLVGYVQTLLNLFIPNFNMDDWPSKLGYSSIILFRNKVDREMSNIEFILRMLYQFDPKSRVVIKYFENIKFPQKEHLSIKDCIEPFAYKQRYSFCSKIGDFSLKIQPVGYGTFFKTIFSYSSSNKKTFENFLEESDIINFIKRNKDHIKLL